MRIDSHTELYGIIGNPVRHSFSPFMHNAAFRKLGINAVYLAFEVSDLKSAIMGVRALGIKGLSVTIPFKTAIIEYLDEVSDLALMIGAVNTVINSNGRLIGTNTDAFGFYSALKNETTIKGKNIAIFGSGGSARAGVFSLFYYDEPGIVYLVARNKEKREKIRRDIIESFLKGGRNLENNIYTLELAGWNSIKDSVDIIVNTTPVGMKPDVNNSIITEEELPWETVVMDIVYNPKETLLIKMAKKKRCKVVYGIEMLLLQGIKQFELWTGKKPPISAMKKAIKIPVICKID